MPATHSSTFPAAAGALHISFHPAVVRRIQSVLNSTSAETGGVLFGRIEDGEARVSIDACELIPSRCAQGHVYSDPDVEQLCDIAGMPASGPGPVGLFRTNLRPKMAPSAEDVRLMERHFARPRNLLLLVQGGSADQSVAKVFAWENGRLDTERPYAQLLGRRQGAWTARPGRAGLDAAAWRPRSRAKTPWIVGAIAAAGLLSVGVAQYRTLRTTLGTQSAETRAAAPAGSLDLTMQRAGSEWRIGWNRESPAIRRATRGRMTIVDGQYRRDLELSAGELQAGSVFYVPLFDDVSFRLEVFSGDDGRVVTELIRVLPNSLPPGPLDARSTQRDFRQSLSGPPAQGPPGTPDAGKAAAAQTETRAGEHRPAKTWTPPNPQPRAANGPDLPLPGNVASASPAPVADLQLTGNIPAAPPPPAPEKTEEARVPEVRAAIPAGGRIEGGEPRVRADPVYPMAARAAGVSGSVRLTAVIGTDGRVRDVKVLSGHALLQDAARNAVLKWQYNPTLLNGRPVEVNSEVEVKFNMPPGSSRR